MSIQAVASEDFWIPLNSESMFLIRVVLVQGNCGSKEINRIMHCWRCSRKASVKMRRKEMDNHLQNLHQKHLHPLRPSECFQDRLEKQ